MTTHIRAELAKTNEFAIPKERGYELKHFCYQYEDWKSELSKLNVMQHMPDISNEKVQDSNISDPTSEAAEKREYYISKILMIHKAANMATPIKEVSKAIVACATDPDMSYDCYDALYGIPYGKKTFYRLYRKFFWHLSALRG